MSHVRASLWLVPEVGTRSHQLLAYIMTRIALVKNSPFFTPHCTLYGAVEGEEADLRERTERLASMLIPYELEFGALGSNGFYTQILFAEVKPIEAVVDANRLAHEVFCTEQKTYFPHVSLAYGNFTPPEVHDLMKFVEAESPLLSGCRFLVSRVELWQTEGPVDAWRKLGSFPMNC